MYAFVNEVVRMKTPFPFDCESAQVMENAGGLLIVDKEDRRIAVEHKSLRLCLSLDDKRTEGVKQIKYKGRCYREVILAWLAACIRYTSLQPELREELMQYVQSIKRTTISESKKSNMQNLHNSGSRKICESHFWRRKAMCKFCTYHFPKQKSFMNTHFFYVLLKLVPRFGTGFLYLCRIKNL
jgi:hypothetical protein